MGGEWRQYGGAKWDRLVSEEVVEGGIPESAFPAMVAEIQRRLDLVGHASVIGGTLTWSPAAQSEDTRKIVISVTPREGRTAIRLQERVEILGIKRVIFPVGGVIGLAFGGAIAAGLGMPEPVGPPLMILSALGGVFAAFRTTVSIEAGERGPQLQALGKALAEIGREEREKQLGPGEPSG